MCAFPYSWAHESSYPQALEESERKLVSTPMHSHTHHSWHIQTLGPIQAVLCFENMEMENKTPTSPFFIKTAF